VNMSDTISLVEDLRDAVDLAEKIDLSESVLADIVIDLIVRHGYGGRLDGSSFNANEDSSDDDAVVTSQASECVNPVIDKQYLVDKYLELKSHWDERIKDKGILNSPSTPACHRYPQYPDYWYSGKPIWVVDFGRIPSFSLRIADESYGNDLGLVNTCSK